jgi:hypothetical protein
VGGGHLLGFDRAQDRSGVETAMKNSGRAQNREGELLDSSADVEQRHDDEHDVGAPRAAFVRDAPRRFDDSGVAQHHALRPAGRPAGIDEIGDVIIVDRNVGRRIGTSVRDGFVGFGAVMGAADTDQHAERCDSPQELSCEVLELRMENEGRWLAVAADVDQLLCRQTIVHVHDNEICAFAGAEDLKIFEAIRCENGDALPPQPACQQRIGQAEGARGKFRMGAPAVLKEHRSAARIEAGIPQGDIAEIHEI